MCVSKSVTGYYKQTYFKSLIKCVKFTGLVAYFKMKLNRKVALITGKGFELTQLKTF